MRVLVSLHRGYGLGDAVQMSAVLRHVAKHRAHWLVDYQAEEGRHQVGRGLVQNTFAYGQPYPTAHYDAEVLLCLYDKWHGYTDRPNTRVSSCLKEHFNLSWDAECGRYSVAVSQEVMEAAATLVCPGGSKVGGPRRSRPWNRGNSVVAVHYQGDSCPHKKDLTHSQAERVCKAVEGLGRTPLLVDWRDTSPLTDKCHLRTTGRLPTSREWGADAEMNCAVIAQCEAFVGIDSGPGKCASATDTPSLIVWTGHHPAPFHDPAPNTTHLVPVGYHAMPPVCGDRAVVDWFERHYSVLLYSGDPVPEVAAWLGRVLK